ncbi:hypothetical protein [Streptomyces sp. NPDC003710]
MSWRETAEPDRQNQNVLHPGPPTAALVQRRKKIRHAETVEADVVGYTGSAARPRALAVRLPDGRIALTQSLKAPLAAQVAVHLTASGPPRSARTRAGDTYTTVAPGLIVEVLAGTTRRR